jgi:hypothetical protein
MAINLHELHNSIKYEPGYGPVATAVADNTAMATAIIDTQGYQAVEFIIQTGTLADADATFAVTIAQSDASNMASPEAVPSECLVGTLAAASFTFAADGVVKTIGVVPSKGAGKRYIQLTVTPSGNSGAAPMAVVVAKLPLTYPAA